jgi:predicted nucleotidyltransferase
MKEIYTEKDIEIVKGFILNMIPLVERIILFGSYARNEANEKSDMDFLVLTSTALERKKKLDVLTQIRWESAQKGYDVDFILKTNIDFEKDKKLPTISKIIDREGKLIWMSP